MSLSRSDAAHDKRKDALQIDERDVFFGTLSVNGYSYLGRAFGIFGKHDLEGGGSGFAHFRFSGAYHNLIVCRSGGEVLTGNGGNVTGIAAGGLDFGQDRSFRLRFTGIFRVFLTRGECHKGSSRNQ